MINQIGNLDRNKIEEILVREKKNIFTNLTYLKNGYSFASMRRIMQADVPIIIAAEGITLDEIKILQKYREKVCILSVNEAWKLLFKHGVLPDLMIGDSLGEFHESLNETVYIANIEEKNKILKYHQGKQFFYWSEDILAKYLSEEAQKKSDYIYTYNIMMQFPMIQNVYDRAVYIANYIGADQVIVLGKDDLDSSKIKSGTFVSLSAEQSMILMDIVHDCEQNCHLKDVLDELLPILDDNGAEELDHIMDAIKIDLKKTSDCIADNIQLYTQLYEMAKCETVYKDDLDNIVSRINYCTALLSKRKILFYVNFLLARLDHILPETRMPDKQNEITQIAENEIFRLQRIEMICSYLSSEFELLKLSDKRRKAKGSKHYQNVLCVYGESQYDVLPNFMNGMKKGFHQMGYDVYQWDLTKESMAVNGYNIYQNTIGYNYIVMMNGVSIEGAFTHYFSGCHQLWFENKNTKVAAIFVDHPRRHIERLKYAKDGVAVFFMDKNCCDYLEKYMPQVPAPCYIHMGGVKQEFDTKFLNRQNKIVFFGSKLNLKTLSDEINKSLYKGVIWKVIEELKVHPQKTIEETMIEVGEKYRCAYAISILMVASDVLLIVDEYIRAYFRERVVKEIAKSGIPFEVYGWASDDLLQYSNVAFKERVCFADMLEIYQKNRFVLNVQAWTKDGIHERVLNTMLAGAVSVTDPAKFIEREFCDGESVLLYHLDELEKLPEMLRYYMEHPDIAEEIALKGHKIVSEKHTWQIRAGEVLDLLKE